MKATKTSTLAQSLDEALDSDDLFDPEGGADGATTGGGDDFLNFDPEENTDGATTPGGDGGHNVPEERKRKREEKDGGEDNKKEKKRRHVGAGYFGWDAGDSASGGDPDRNVKKH
jgi:hypothetical protein